MSQFANFFAPSDRALEFGATYAQVLARWADLFTAASALVAANVEMGRQATDASKEFDAWLRQTASGPWGLLTPDLLQRFMQGIGKPPGQAG